MCVVTAIKMQGYDTIVVDVLCSLESSTVLLCMWAICNTEIEG
jgi:hypothetical protein